MSLDSNQLETLKTILENSLQPQRLDTHPWTKSLIVLASGTEPSGLQDKSPGQQLVIAIEKIFNGLIRGGGNLEFWRLNTLPRSVLERPRLTHCARPGGVLTRASCTSFMENQKTHSRQKKKRPINWSGMNWRLPPIAH